MFLKRFFVYGAALLAICMFCPQTGYAVLGDCDNNGVVEVADAASIIDYLFLNGEIPDNYAECDCDGFPGVNYGDIIQIVGYLFLMQSLYGPPGTDIPVTSDVQVYTVGEASGSGTSSVQVRIKVPDEYGIVGFVLPFSFEAEDGQANVECSGISTENAVINAYYGYDNSLKIFYVHYPGLSPGSMQIPAGTNGLLCTATFSSISPGDPNDVRIVTSAKVWPFILKQAYYTGVDRQRIYLPGLGDSPIGDSNCDHVVNVSDAVWIINYVFIGGSAPGDCD